MPCARSASTIPPRISPDPAVANVGGALALMIARPQGFRCNHCLVRGSSDQRKCRALGSGEALADAVQQPVKCVRSADDSDANSVRNRAKLTSKASRLLHKALATASGGAFGLASLPIELPVSTIIMLRSIADIARSEGENRPESNLEPSSPVPESSAIHGAARR
jgi:hypothetical protein